MTDRKRRAFLVAAATTAAGGLRLIEWAAAESAADDAQPVTGETRWGLLIDTDKCAVDCDACVRACNDEHGLTGTGRPETDAQWIRKVTLTDDHGHVASLPLMCQHCEQPPCVDVCPTGASFRREDGVVLVDKHTCIGCRYCVIACPYQARSFVHENLTDQKSWSPRGKGTVEGCTLCVHRIDEEREPACVEVCNRGDGDDAAAGDGNADCGNGALLFGDLNDPQSAIARRLKSARSRQLRADLDLNTGVRYENL